MDIGACAWRILAMKRIRRRCKCAQPFHQRFEFPLRKSGADAADRNQLLAAINAGEQRAEFTVSVCPAPDDDFLTATAFGLQPLTCASRFVRLIGSFGDYSFESDLAGGLENLLPRCAEMLGVAN